MKVGDGGAAFRTRSNVRGCLFKCAVLSVAAFVGAVYTMSHWATLGGGAKAGAVMLIVVGTLLAMPVAILVGLNLFFHVLARRLSKQLKTVGDQIVGSARAMYGQAHEYREATEADFAGLDRDFYESSKRQLESLGWRHLGDVVDATIEQLNGAASVIRVMTSPDGTTYVGFFHLRASFAHLPDEAILTYDVTSEFTDGEFLLISNTAQTNLMTTPPGIRNLKFPRQTPLEELLAAHEAEKQKLLAARAPGGGCVVVSTLADAIESEKRQQAIKNKFRTGVGYVQSGEVKRIAATVDPTGDVGDDIADAVDEARRRQRPE
jgi:hypothetical protein